MLTGSVVLDTREVRRSLAITPHPEFPIENQRPLGAKKLRPKSISPCILLTSQRPTHSPSLSNISYYGSVMEIFTIVHPSYSHGSLGFTLQSFVGTVWYNYAYDHVRDTRLESVSFLNKWQAPVQHFKKRDATLEWRRPPYPRPD